MPIIKTVSPEEATGEVKQNYAVFDKIGMVPIPFQMFSASPALQSLRVPFMKYFRDHPNLSRGFMAFLRMMVSEELGYQYCVSFNRNLLKVLGIADDDQLAKVMADPDQLPLEDKEKALLRFVLKALSTPDDTTAEDMESLRALGWSDGDILDACAHGMDTKSHGTLVKVFKMDEGESC